MLTINYDPNRRYQINAITLTIGTVIGLILGFAAKSGMLMVAGPVVSQYPLIVDFFKRLTFSDQIKALDRLTNSAGLADIRDNYSTGRYRAAVHYSLKMDADHDVLTIDANGISNTRHLSQLANDVGAAFHHPAYLLEVGNGIATYRIDKTKVVRKVHENDF